jgi:tetratricopeptide (TPR) repeat protein
VLCVLLLLVITIFAVRFGRKQRYLPVGWFWFVVALVPVIGLVQSGAQAYADRYTYIPYIGLFIMVAWGLPGLLSKWPYRRFVIAASAVIALTVLGICAHKQAGYWKNSFTLFMHAIEATQNNYVAYNNLGGAYIDIGRYQEAIKDCSQAIRIRPDFADAHGNRGAAYVKLGLCREAIEDCNQAIKIRPNFAAAYSNRGTAYVALGRSQEAIEDFNQAIRIKPNHADARNNLAWMLATSPDPNVLNPSDAIHLAQEACSATDFKNPAVLDTLAAAYAAAGRFADAVETARAAINLAGDANQPQLKNTIQEHLVFYTQGKPYIEPAQKSFSDSNRP